MPRFSQITGSRRRRAAYFIAEGKMSHGQIATEVGVAERTLRHWYATDEDFRWLVAEKRKAIETELQSMAITTRMGRIEGAIDLHSRLNQLIQDRAEKFADAPGGKTGLVAPKFKKDGTEFEYDSAVVKDLLEIQSHIAEEMGHVNPDSDRATTIVKLPQFPLIPREEKTVGESGNSTDSEPVST